MRQLLSDERGRGTLFVDVREREEFAKARVEGVENLPMSEFVLHWDTLAGASRIFLVCDVGSRSLVAAETLMRLGLAHVGDLAGGMRAWVGSGLPIIR
ncbi:MAG: rhodanese-like domain-containing protein [Deltaproteobacteria bacterium]|nr:rhodanese-like domain-containing protein [Deltaproteobacteria bacterium]